MMDTRWNLLAGWMVAFATLVSSDGIDYAVDGSIPKICQTELKAPDP